MAADSLRVITGPTAAGKSAIAGWLAARRRVVIISADSRHIYRGFDIGTAKPTPAERAAVPHTGVDVADPKESYSAARWAGEATAAVDEARRSGREPLLVGGTGFYLRALFEPLFVEPPLAAAPRAVLAAWLAGQRTDELRRWCLTLDPARARLGRAQLLRAIEIALLTGRRLSALHREAARTARFAPWYLLVDPGPALAGRIERRVAAMLEAGWLDEVRALARCVPETASAWKATGYRTMRRLAAGEISRGEAVERVVIETRQYAKRQRTWFRNQLPPARVTTVDPTAAGWEDVVDEWWGKAA